MTRSSSHSLFFGIGGIIVFLTAWELLSTFVGRSEAFPSATQTAKAAVSLLAAGFGLDLLATVARAVTAWVLSIIAGLSVGVIIGSLPGMHFACKPILAFLRCLPAFLLISIPLSMGIGGEAARLLVIALASAWIIADESAEVTSRLSEDKADILRSIKAGWWFRVRRIHIFEVLGRAFVPVARTSVAICFVISTVVESLAIPQYGVGARLLSLLAIVDTAGAYGFILLTGIAGVCICYALDKVSRRLIFWAK